MGTTRALSAYNDFVTIAVLVLYERGICLPFVSGVLSSSRHFTVLCWMILTLYRKKQDFQSANVTKHDVFADRLFNFFKFLPLFEKIFSLAKKRCTPNVAQFQLVEVNLLELKNLEFNRNLNLFIPIFLFSP